MKNTNFSRHNVMSIGLLTFLTFIMPQKAKSSSFMRGNEILRLCTYNEAIDKSFCDGYIVGVADFMFTNSMIYSVKICIPGGVEVGQLHDVAVNFLKSHPAMREVNADGLIGQSLLDAWPCPK